MPYLFLARAFGCIEEESKRLLITEMMANAFRTVIATAPQAIARAPLPAHRTPRPRAPLPPFPSPWLAAAACV